MDQKKTSAAFRIKEGRDLTISDAKLSGFEGVVDADQIRDVRTTRLDADAQAQKTETWWVKFILAILTVVIGGWTLHYVFGIG